MQEVWKPIVEYDNLYEVSNTGKIRSRKKELIPGKRSDGYLSVNLSKNGVAKVYLIHRIVASAFIENKENKKTVNHKNGIKSDNNVNNLEWATYSENVKHAFMLGLNKTSEKSIMKTIQMNKTKKNKYVLDLNTGVYYDSCREASRILGIPFSVLQYNIVRNRRYIYA